MMRRVGLLAVTVLMLAARASALSTGFTFQGQLRQSGVPTNGICDLQFSLYDAASGGNKIGLTEGFPNVQLQDGVFTVTLNSEDAGNPFGADAFDGADRWLEIAVRCPAGSGSFSAPFSPRQPLKATPYALYAESTRGVREDGVNVAVGNYALHSNIDGDYNTAVGFAALTDPQHSSYNTAIGFHALSGNGIGIPGDGNVAVGAHSLQNHAGDETTAVGFASLLFNRTGGQNTGCGTRTLRNNSFGSGNTAVGYEALRENEASLNTALGQSALHDNTSGERNVAIGQAALLTNTTGGSNTALGRSALRNKITGNDNIAVGNDAGANLTSGSTNIYIGNSGVATESSTTRIGLSQTAAYVAGIFNSVQSGSTVTVTSTGKLGITPSSRRFKQDIRDLDGASDALYRLRPVAYRYIPEVDPDGRQEYGLIAEEVQQVYPELVTYDDEGRPRTVRYTSLTPLLLAEIQRLNARLEALESSCAASTR